ncbi:hypothetical protein C8F01DRAFT_1372369 [Mycena amicta]|nr:hypothetical protein C8F01DRAFT_1372369 [Mycena amicta]
MSQYRGPATPRNKNKNKSKSNKQRKATRGDHDLLTDTTPAFLPTNGHLPSPTPELLLKPPSFRQRSSSSSSSTSSQSAFTTPSRSPATSAYTTPAQSPRMAPTRLPVSYLPTPSRSPTKYYALPRFQTSCPPPDSLDPDAAFV